MTTDWTTDAKGTGQYAEVNGINLYFETHGAGRPMMLLHGGLGSGEMFGPILPLLVERHQVVAVDLQGHGRTADIDRPIDVRLMADDIAALIDHLELEEPDLVGYSLGGGVAMEVIGRSVATAAEAMGVRIAASVSGGSSSSSGGGWKGAVGLSSGGPGTSGARRSWRSLGSPGPADPL